MNNLAKKLETPKEVIDLFTEEYKSIDLLKMFLLTGANDVSKTFEMLTQWEKKATTPEQRGRIHNAQNTLQNILLKRIELTGLVYGVNETSATVAPVTTTVEALVVKNEELVGDTSPVRLSVPMNNIMEKAKEFLKGAVDKIASTADITDEIAGNIQAEAFSEAFHLFKETLGEGNYLTPDGKKSKRIWTGEEISEHLDVIARDYFSVDNSELKQVETAEVKEFTYNDIAAIVKSSFEANKTVDVIHEEVKSICLGGKIKDNNTVITNDNFDTIVNYVNSFYNSLVTIAKPKAEKEELLVKAKEGITEDLVVLDADPKANTIVGLIKKFREFFLNGNVSLSLKDAKAEVEAIVKEKAANLWNRYTNKTPEKVVVDVIEETPSIEIYDNSHNYEGSNPELFASAKEITTMPAMFEKAKQLVVENRWKDALAMVIHLTSNNQIVVKEGVHLTFTADQAKGWFKQNILETKPIEEIKDATIVVEEPVTEATPEVDVTATVEVTEKAKVQGPVPTVGFDANAPIYPMVGGVQVADDNLVECAVTVKLVPKKDIVFMVAPGDVSVDYPCRADFEAKMEAIIDILAANSNHYKQAKTELVSFLSVPYEIKPTTVKDMMAYFVTAGINRRKASKANAVVEAPVTETTETVETKVEEVVETSVAPEVEETVVETPVETAPVEETVVEEVVETPVEAPVTEEVPVVEETTEVAPATEEVVKEASPLAESQTESEEQRASPESSTTQETVVTENTSGSDTTPIDPIVFKAAQPILTAKNKSSFNQAIGKFYLDSSGKDKDFNAADVIFNIIVSHRKDKAYKKCQVSNYRTATDEHLKGTIANAIENSKVVTA